MFQLKKGESDILISHSVISRWGGIRKLPLAFTEQGIAMLSSVLRSKRAIAVNIQIMRIFTRLREMFATHKELGRKLNELEGRIGKHDQDIQLIFDAIRKMISVEEKPRKRIGFYAQGE